MSCYRCYRCENYYDSDYDGLESYGDEHICEGCFEDLHDEDGNLMEKWKDD